MYYLTTQVTVEMLEAVRLGMMGVLFKANVLVGGQDTVSAHPRSPRFLCEFCAQGLTSQQPE